MTEKGVRTIGDQRSGDSDIRTSTAFSRHAISTYPPISQIIKADDSERFDHDDRLGRAIQSARIPPPWKDGLQ